MKIIQEKNGRFKVEVDGRIVGEGIMVAGETEDEMAYLERIDIQERNKGYGTKALYELLEIYGPFFTAPDNPGCKRWMERHLDEHNGEGWPVDQGYGVHELK